LVGKPEEKRLPGIPRYKRLNNIKMDIRAVGWTVWTGLVSLKTGAS
jgi:hypothetical protein